MGLTLTDICRQLRLAYIVETLSIIKTLLAALNWITKALFRLPRRDRLCKTIFAISNFAKYKGFACYISADMQGFKC